jgi:hypothetical protein
VAILAKDLRIKLEDRPGALATIGEALGQADVNIDGICGFARDMSAREDRELITHTFHILVEDPAKARTALNKFGIIVEEERDVVIPKVIDRPGEIGRICRRLAGAGINIDFLYTITDTRFVLGVDDIETARKVLKL